MQQGISAFDARALGQKGSGEWRTINPVRYDHIDMFKVARPDRLMAIQRLRAFLASMRPQPTNRRLRGAH